MRLDRLGLRNRSTSRRVYPGDRSWPRSLAAGGRSCSVLCHSSDPDRAAAAAIVQAPAAKAKQADSSPIQPVIDGMKGAGDRLKHGDTGPGTRAIQEKAVSDLQKLIDAAKSKSKSGNPSSKQGSRKESGTQNGEKSQEGPAAAKSGKPEGANGRPGRPTKGGKQPVSVQKSTAGNPQRPLLREVWGHLPPAMRERVVSDFQETVLPAYDDLVRRYFEALLDSSTPSGSKRPAAAPGQATP